MKCSNRSFTLRAIKTKQEQIKLHGIVSAISPAIFVTALVIAFAAYDYAKQGAKTAVETGVKTVKKSTQLTKRVYKKLHKPTTAELKRTLRKRIYRNKLKSQVNYLAKQTVRKGTKAAANAAKMARCSSVAVAK